MAIEGLGLAGLGTVAAVAAPVVVIGGAVAYVNSLLVHPVLSSQVPGGAARDATATGPLLNRAEERQIRAAIQSVTSKPATNSQYKCMSDAMHDCKDKPDDDRRNEKGDFSWKQLKELAEELFGDPD